VRKLLLRICIGLQLLGAYGLWAQTGAPEQVPVVVPAGSLPLAGGAEGAQLVPGSEGYPVFTVVELQIDAPYPDAAAKRAHEKRMRKYNRLEQNVRAIYPMALTCARVVERIDAEMTRLGTRKDQKAFAKRLEKELFEHYEPILRKMTLSQGKLLLKLIDRQTGTSAYTLIKEYKSGTSAVFWQMVAKVFGADLKTSYDPEAEFVIETIIYDIHQEAAAAQAKPQPQPSASNQ
jgi:Domain of unknown function (DUF4294)